VHEVDDQREHVFDVIPVQLERDAAVLTAIFSLILSELFQPAHILLALFGDLEFQILTVAHNPAHCSPAPAFGSGFPPTSRIK
jgi:hypothetical protein